MTAAISFDGHWPADEKPIGIDVATRQFIRAHFRYAQQGIFYCVAPNEAAARLYRKFGAEEDIAAERCISINQNDAMALETAGCLIRYDPGIIKHAWTRRYHGENRYSLCGIAHACASESVMDMFGQYLTAPLNPWDAVICPSQAIKGAITSILEGWKAYLDEKFGVKPEASLHLPVIPLGVDTADMAHRVSGGARAAQRKKLGIERNEIVILYVGRLNHVAKSNPISLLLAAEQAAKRCDHPIRLVFNGYYHDKANQVAFEQATQALCDNATVSYVLHGDPEFPDGAWAAGDIFCSLSDNIQESFGLTPVEAMAAGLPIIASDWNGYKETVRDGEDGLLIPTYMPPAGAGETIAYRYFAGQFSYGDYLGATSQATSVDLTVLTESILALASNQNLRLSMGASGKRRVLENFDWSRVIENYETLWQELTRRRASSDAATSGETPALHHPSRPDPFFMFSGFPTKHLDLDGSVTVLETSGSLILQRIQLKLGLVQADVLMDLELLPGFIGELEAKKTIKLKDLADVLDIDDFSKFLVTAGWLVKLGLCRYDPP